MLTHFTRPNLTRMAAAAVVAGQLCLAPLSAQTGGFLKLTVIEGEGAFNDMKHKISHPPAVRVVDESNNLVKGAEVTCTLPAVGASGQFADNKRSGTGISDDTGIARCPAFKPNTEEGRFNIKLTAAYQGKTGSIVISQSNTTAGGTSVGDKKSNKTVWIVVAVAGGAAGGILAATHKGTSAPPVVPPVTLTAGAITVGGPR
jgi:hypothetical protein